MQRAVIVVICLALTALSYRLWLSDEGLREVWRLGGAIATQDEQNASLRARNGALEAEVLDLREGFDAIEERARQDLGMTRSGETFFQVVDAPDGADRDVD
jgi:cell division protein FtsB